MALLLNGLRVLILEDEFLIAMDVEQLCRDNGASDVVIVREVDEMDVGQIKTAFDVAIVDLMLNGASTIDFAATLRDHEIPFVFASGYSDTPELASAFPGVRLVQKPYSGDDLIEAVAAASRRTPEPAN